MWHSKSSLPVAHALFHAGAPRSTNVHVNRPASKKHEESMQHVRNILKRTGWTQQQLADHLGVEPTMVRKWATGRNAPSFVNTMRLGKVVAELENRGRDPLDVEMISLYHRLPPVRRAQLLVDISREVEHPTPK
jgi:DNA-binding transcriptional regulator YiaG